MPRAIPIYLVAALAGFLAMPMAGRADEAPPGQDTGLTAEDQLVPEVNARVIAEVAGLDKKTLGMIGLTESQREAVRDRVGAFLSDKRPHLLTHRMIWLEMRERYRNLEAGSKANAFDPCEFVTDEALRDAAGRLRDARRRFEATCQEVHDDLEGMLDSHQMALVRNAAGNHGLPSPYRWLHFDEDQRKAVRRVVEVHLARRALVERYPHLSSRFREGDMARQIASLLSDEQKDELAALTASLNALEGADAQTTREGEA